MVHYVFTRILVCIEFVALRISDVMCNLFIDRFKRHVGLECFEFLHSLISMFFVCGRVSWDMNPDTSSWDSSLCRNVSAFWWSVTPRTNWEVVINA